MGRIFFRRANLIDGRNAPKKNATIVVENDRIGGFAGPGAGGTDGMSVQHGLAGFR